MKKSGFTLIEILLYVSISVSVILAAFSLYSIGIESRSKSEAINTVNYNASGILSLIEGTIHSANSVNLTEGEEAGELSLNMELAEENPAIFTVEDGALYITEGVEEPLQLLDPDLELTNFVVQNLSQPGTTPLIKVSFTLSTGTEAATDNYFTNDFTSSFLLK